MSKRSPGLETARPTVIRCAIYTRKSSEEGLEQEFNSLHAQREACQAYILSQRHEGWRVSPTLYDDGGVSGGTMERPALARLLDDIRARRIDLVVIYKVDRLTRSLADFAKLVDIFNASSVSFVSVTQQFNTATSMGRLTLNMLLSFAQFEREVTGERIRDKIAASKRKGMWMGGHPPLGYDVQDRKLVINPIEAAQVVHLFQTYVRLGSVRLLSEQSAAEGLTSKKRCFANGKTSGGRPLLRGNLYEMLQNRLYRGEIAHRGHVYPGEHQPIIGQPLWDQAQAMLSAGRVERSRVNTASRPSLLAGIIFDASSARLTPTHANKGRKRYRYYVSQRLMTGTGKTSAAGQRLPAGELEGLVTAALLRLIGDPASLIGAIGSGSLQVVDQQRIVSAAQRLSGEWPDLNLARLRYVVRTIVTRVEVQSSQVSITISAHRLVDVLLGGDGLIDQSHRGIGAAITHIITVPAALRRVGQEMRLIIPSANRDAAADPTLARLVQQGLEFRQLLLTTHGHGIAELSAAAGVSGSHFTRVLRLGFLAPDIVAAIAEGRQPPGLTATKLLRDTRLPLVWAGQRAALGFSQPA